MDHKNNTIQVNTTYCTTNDALANTLEWNGSSQATEALANTLHHAILLLTDDSYSFLISSCIPSSWWSMDLLALRTT
jgi:hypothetical protein